MEWIAGIIVAIVSGIASFAGVAVTNSKHQAVIDERLDNLTKQVEKHNSVIERTYILERDVAVLKATIDERSA